MMWLRKGNILVGPAVRGLVYDPLAGYSSRTDYIFVHSNKAKSINKAARLLGFGQSESKPLRSGRITFIKIAKFDSVNKNLPNVQSRYKRNVENDLTNPFENDLETLFLSDLNFLYR